MSNFSSPSSEYTTKYAFRGRLFYPVYSFIAVSLNNVDAFSHYERFPQVMSGYARKQVPESVCILYQVFYPLQDKQPLLHQGAVAQGY